MAILDREQKLPGYFDSAWPVECGGTEDKRRRKESYYLKILSQK